MEKIAYGGWQNCIRLSNGNIELVVTTDVGPRVIRFGFIGQNNEFYENKDQLGKTGGTEYMGYGGHRFWLAPETKPRTYHPDNAPVEFSMDDSTLILRPVIESTTGIRKELGITLDVDKNHVTVIHKATNHNLWAVEFAPWALSVMAAGGKAIIPQEPYSPHPAIPDYPGQVIDQRYFLPVRSMILWSYTKLNDPRWTFTSKYIILQQDPAAKSPQKLGVSNEQKWAAYANGDHLFIKTFDYQPSEVYPDNGSNFETFTNSEMLEMESLGPMVKLEPEASVTHREDWYLFDDSAVESTDESIDAVVLPKAISALDLKESII